MTGESFSKRQSALHTSWKQHSNCTSRALDDMSPKRFLWEQQNHPLKYVFMWYSHFISKGFISQGFSRSSRTTSAYDSVILRTKCKRSLYYKSTWILLAAVRNLNVTYRPLFCFIMKCLCPLFNGACYAQSLEVSMWKLNCCLFPGIFNSPQLVC